MSDFEAAVGWLHHGGGLYVNVDDLVALLREGDYGELAEDFESIAAEERTDKNGPRHRGPSLTAGEAEIV